MDLDKSMIGIASKPYIAEIDREHVTRFAQAIGDENPLYFDETYAAGTAYEGVTVPPTFLVALGSNAEFPLKLDFKRMLHGEHEFIYHQPVRIGDRLECTMAVTDVYDRVGKSGTMQFLVLDTEMKTEDGVLAAVSRNTIIYRPAHKGAN
ncbi:MaoC family dehydratase N-terminal domain-containing protein [Sporosarcina gallistercoris]|uniref:MaoC family dehydratase N-terminal domain-containing protein n=1 Tax=Sporosarcina gallistercoris TaxID=2762245 RepID=A0ABR8PMH5_9BACL|nr:MaoC family dehydratase N-terminal domain-containing protein [Sporosarcina gallistercoris]MBD7909380.1 MaoC family dehydratase N-terminal domain-containing protein [Sporosarcina gallistercoris]